jgi:putative molybdopterin biosynthesis protein
MKEKLLLCTYLTVLKVLIKMFRKLLTLDEAKHVIQQRFKPRPLGIETIPLLDTYNRVLAENVIATLDIPSFNRSTVDGYAVKAEDTFGADENKPVKLKICGTVNAGEPPKVTVTKGKSAEIVTGAPLPDGADAVVMVEHTERNDNDLYVYSAASPHENVMKAGADIKKGETVLRAGQPLGSREIGVLAALGMIKVEVYAVPRVSVLSTGAEITEPGRNLSFGKIYDINAYSLSAAVQESGGKPIYLGVFPDDTAQLQKVLKQALSSADLITTSGGVSVGPKDAMPETLDSLGKPGIIVCGIAIKPGKPTTVALIDRKLIFSLPGHPASALLVFHLLVRPIIQHMAGIEVSKSLTIKAITGTRLFPAKGRRTFIMVKLRSEESGRSIVDPVATGLSGAITTLAKADGFVEIAENQQFIDANEEVTAHLFKSREEIKF